MSEKSNLLLNLLRAGKRFFINPTTYQIASDTIDQISDVPKAGLNYYAKEFNPSAKQIDNLQDVKDWIGGFSAVPFAPPFLGRSQWDRGYLPHANFAMGTDTSGGFGMYTPYTEMAMRSNNDLRNEEQSQNDALRKPFEDWQMLHGAVKQRFDDTVKFQDSLRKNPQFVKQAGGDPKKLARMIHDATLARNKQLRDQGRLFNAGDSLRGYAFYKDPLTNTGSLKPGNMTETVLDLPDMTGRRPYIIR